MTKLATIAAHIASVTPAEIGRCHKVFIGNKAAYMVESESDPTKEYRVEYTSEHGFTCQCMSGQHGFASVKHPSGVCKHVRWAVACSLEEKAALAEQDRLNAQPVGMYTNVDSATLARVLAAKPAPVKRASSLPQSRAFQLMR